MQWGVGGMRKNILLLMKVSGHFYTWRQNPQYQLSTRLGYDVEKKGLCLYQKLYPKHSTNSHFTDEFSQFIHDNIYTNIRLNKI
jgi:hypothetical protein